VLQQFVSERKLYEDLSLEQRFMCDVSQIFDNIEQFGEGLCELFVILAVTSPRVLFPLLHRQPGTPYLYTFAL